MELFSAKFKIISSILNTPDTWNIVADVIDNRGLFYAADAKIGDIVLYKSGADLLKYKVIEIAAATGARLFCKLQWINTTSPVAPSLTSDAIIGTVNNGSIVLPDNSVQVVNIDYTAAVVGDPIASKTAAPGTNDETYATTAFVNSVTKFTHEQLQAASIWLIKHDMYKCPSVTVVDSAGDEVMGEIDYLDLNNIKLTFSGAFSGVAYLT